MGNLVEVIKAKKKVLAKRALILGGAVIGLVLAGKVFKEEEYICDGVDVEETEADTEDSEE